MAKLSTKDRNKLPASEFGIPDKRKFPLNDAAHVEDAARKVGYAQGADKKPLARKILSRARKYNLDTSGWKKVKLFAQEQVPPMSDGTSIGNAPPHTLAPYYEEDELMKRVKGLSNSNEAQTNVLTMARNIASRIHAKYVADQKPPTGNQNCQLCTWCAEANFRGINVLPRPIYSPRDPAFDVCAESIVMNPDRKEFPNFQELNDWIMTQPNARFYVHVKWNGGTGGHEFMLINFNIPHILDPQQGIFEPTTSLKIFNDYFGNIDYSESYICRLDDRPLNKALLTKMNSMTMLVPWDESKDIPYMREHGMLCDEDEQYLKDHGRITSDDPVQESFMDEYSQSSIYKMRPAKESDLDFVYYSELETVDENKNDPKVQRYIKQDAKDSLGHTKIIVVDNNDVGVYQAYATNYWGVREGKRDWWYLAHIYIKPEYQGRGIGTEIIKNDISEHDKILLQVMKSNPRAKKLYESLGFVVSQENDHGGLVMRLEKSKTVQESAKDNYASDKPIPIQNYNSDIVYFGCAKKLNDKIDIDKQLFITPYKGIASIFAADRPWVRQLFRMGIRSFNSDYDEWNQTDGLDEPLKVVHVRVHDYDGKSFEPFELTGNGFIYAIDISKLKDHVAKYEWMDQSKEALLVDLNEVPIKDMQPVTIRYIIRPDVENFQEGAFQDIKNGVNPFSDNLVFHITPDKYADGQVWEPRVPDYLDPYNPEETGFEDNTTPRICFSTSIEGCLNGITVNLPRHNPDQFDKLYVYIPEKPWKEYKHKTNKELVKNKLVYDANVTREVWIMEPVRMKLYGVIRVDQVSNAKWKSVVPTSKGEKDTRNYFTYKWHWVVKPRVLEKATKFDYSPEKVIDNLCIDLKKFKYGLIRNGRLMIGNVSDADYNKYWVYHSAQEVDEAGGGNCYDMVEYEANYLKSYGVPYKTYFMSFTTTTNKPINTHTICVVPYEGKFIYIEQAFKRVTDEWGHMRRRTFDTLNEIFQYVAECAADAEDKKQINFGVWDYTNEKIDYGTPIQEFMKWIYTHTKMIYDGTAKPFKPTKEAYVPMRPSRFVLEGNDETITVGDIDLDEQDDDSDSDDGTTVEEKETTKTITEKIEPDNDDDESDYDVSNVDLGTFGSDTSDVQNEYDPKEIEILMKLMASEADAMNEYMDGAKDTNVDVLRRLYADIANEERFHMEQLLFAKSEITGEKYEPKDPDVKKEYEELLAMGMDEATAMSTAVDKFHIRGSVSEDDGDVDIDELKEDMTTVEMAMNFFSRNFDELMTVLESGTYDPAKTSQAVNVFMESFYMEDVAGPTAKDINRGNWNQGPKGIIGALKKALGFILNMLGTIIRKFGNFLKKIKDIKKKYKTIHDVNGRTWKALFQDGVKFYFFNPKSASTGYIDADSLKKYSDIITHLTALCSKQVVGHYETSDISKDSLNELGTLRFDNIQKGIAIIERTNLQQIKYVIDESTSQMLDKLCFGTNNSANVNGKMLSGKYDSATGEYRSFNVYNFLEDQSARWKKILEYENEVLDGFQNVKDQQLNTSAYRDAINGMKACIKGAKAFVNALSADLNQLMKINQTAIDEMKQHDAAKKTPDAKKADAPAAGAGLVP